MSTFYDLSNSNNFAKDNIYFDCLLLHLQYLYVKCLDNFI